MNGISDRSHFFPDKTGSQFSSLFDSNVRLSVSIGSEKEAKIVKIARTFSGPGLLVSHDPEQTRYLAEILDDSNVKCSVFTADSSLEDNRKSLENITSRMVKIFAVDESSCTVLPDELKFRFIINEIIPDSLEELAIAMINNLDISSEAYHFLLYDVRDRYLKENKLKIKHAENYDDQRRAVLLLSPVEDYCFSAECRVKYLKKHFLGTGKYANCGKCDLCKKAVLSSPDYFEEKDRITAILECITETREKFGKNTICDTLRGRYSKTVRSYRLYRAMTFALFHDVPRKDINRIINDLLEKNILRQTRGTYPTVSISPAGRNLFDLSEVSPLELPKRMEIAPGESVDFALIEKIRDFRRAQAKTLNLPAFMVFKDRVLKEIVQNNPHSKEELIRIKGFGDRSWNICGGALLKLLNTETSRTE